MKNSNNKIKNIRIKYSVIVIIFIILFALALIIVFSNNSNGVGTAGINKQEFEKIQLGMTQFEVNSIIDEKDEWNDDEVYEKCCEEISNSSNNSVYTYIYKYYGENSGYATVTFEANYSNGDLFVMPTVSKKENFNL